MLFLFSPCRCDPPRCDRPGWPRDDARRSGRPSTRDQGSRDGDSVPVVCSCFFYLPHFGDCVWLVRIKWFVPAYSSLESNRSLKPHVLPHVYLYIYRDDMTAPAHLGHSTLDIPWRHWIHHQTPPTRPVSSPGRSSSLFIALTGNDMIAPVGLFSSELPHFGHCVWGCHDCAFFCWK